MTQSEFNALWEIDELPACPVGMVLLKDWADTFPPVKDIRRLVAMALQDGIHSNLPEWIAVEQHFSTCAE